VTTGWLSAAARQRLDSGSTPPRIGRPVDPPTSQPAGRPAGRASLGFGEQPPEIGRHDGSRRRVTGSLDALAGAGIAARLDATDATVAVSLYARGGGRGRLSV